jgi:heptosyltransferase-1
MERLLIVRLGSLGDIVHTLPAASLLRRALPHATIGWAIEERWSALLLGDTPEASPLVDRLHFINARSWRRALLSDETWREIVTEMGALRDERYEAAIDFQGLWKSAALALWSGAPERVGFDRPRERPASMFYTRRVDATAKHIFEQNLQLAAAVVPGALPEIRFPIAPSATAEAWCDAELRRRGVANFVLLSAGAGWGAKLWPAENFAEVARGLCAQGLSVLVNCGPGEETLARLVEEKSEGAAQAVPCSLAELIALTRRARLFIGGDTGPSHIAAALGIPVVAIFGPTDPERNGPYGSRTVVLRAQTSATSYSHTAAQDPGLLSIVPADVLAAAFELLGTAA